MTLLVDGLIIWLLLNLLFVSFLVLISLFDDPRNRGRLREAKRRLAALKPQEHRNGYGSRS